jgi:hypothetical protein
MEQVQAQLQEVQEEEQGQELRLAQDEAQVLEQARVALVEAEALVEVLESE